MKRASLLTHLVLLGAVLGALSCQRAKEEKADLGPQATGEEIDHALALAVGRSSLAGMHVGQYVNYSILRRLENSENVIVLGTVNVNVANADKSGDPTQTKYTLEIAKSYRQENGGFQTVLSEEPLVVDHGSALTSQTLTADAIRIAQATVRARGVAGVLAAQPKKVTYHKLRSSTGTMPVPERVAGRSGCGGVSPCELPVRYLRFDIVAWYTDTDYQKVSLDFAFSSSTPWIPFGKEFDQLSGILIADCRSTYVPVEDRNVYVRDCQQLDDFQK